jgi:hypothetical protein
MTCQTVRLRAIFVLREAKRKIQISRFDRFNLTVLTRSVLLGSFNSYVTWSYAIATPPATAETHEFLRMLPVQNKLHLSDQRLIHCVQNARAY